MAAADYSLWTGSQRYLADDFKLNIFQLLAYIEETFLSTSAALPRNRCHFGMCCFDEAVQWFPACLQRLMQLQEVDVCVDLKHCRLTRLAMIIGRSSLLHRLHVLSPDLASCT